MVVVFLGVIGSLIGLKGHMYVFEEVVAIDELEEGVSIKSVVGKDRIVDTSKLNASKVMDMARESFHDGWYGNAVYYFEKASMKWEEKRIWESYIYCLIQMGEAARMNGTYEEAQVYLERAMNTGKQRLGLSHKYMAEIFNKWGNLLTMLGQYDQAIEWHEKSLEIQQDADNVSKIEIGRSHFGKGVALREKGHYASAQHEFDTALKMQLSILGYDHPEVALSYNEIGILSSKLGNYYKAIEYYEKSLMIRKREFGDIHPDVAISYNNLGVEHVYRGDYDKAMTYYKASLLIRLDRFGDRHPHVASTYNNIGIILEKQGDYDHALDYQFKALYIRNMMLDNWHPKLGQTYDNIGNVYRKKGDFEKALSYHWRSSSIRERSQGPQHPDYAWSLTNIGNDYLESGRLDSAQIFLDKALQVWEISVGDTHPEAAQTYTSLARVSKRQGDYDAALAYLWKAIQIWKDHVGSQHPDIAVNFNVIGQIYTERGMPEEALEAYSHAIRSNTFSNSVRGPSPPPFEEVLEEDVFLETLHGQARAFTALFKTSASLSDLQASLTSYVHAAHLIERIRRSYKAEGSKLQWASRVVDLYDEAIQVSRRLYTRTHAERYKQIAFDFAERNKTTILLDALAESNAKQFVDIPDSLLERERQLRVDLAHYKHQLVKEQIREEKRPDQIAVWQNKFFEHQQTYEALIEHFEDSYPAYYDLKYKIGTVSVEDIQGRLVDKRTTLVEYFVGADSIFIFTVAKKLFTITSVPRDTSLERHVKSLRHGIFFQEYRRYLDSAHHLYNLLLKPIADMIDVSNLIVVPDAILTFLPFEILLEHPVDFDTWDWEFADLPYVLQQLAVSYAYSSTLLFETRSRERTPPPSDFVAFAPVFPDGFDEHSRANEVFEGNQPFLQDIRPKTDHILTSLPASEQEVNRIRRLFTGLLGIGGNGTQVYLEGEASEAKLKSPDLANYRYVHLSTHGFINESMPDLSSIVLAYEPSSAEDGVLHLSEVYNLKLNADLVVLSACETGLGQIAKGEGMIGFTRGFFYAGASNLTVSLWKVDDLTTADFMLYFYRALRTGTNKAQALRKAKLQMMNRDEFFARPIFWASFVLLGS